MKKIRFFTFLGILMTVIIFTSPLFAETMRGIRVVSKKGDSLYLYKSYHAMVIGISDYEYWPKLPNAIKDAKEVAQKLQKFGFETKLVLDPTYREMKTAINELIYKMGNEENRAILFYYAGHGETETLADKTKMGYVIPKDCPLFNDDPMGFASHAVSMRDIESASLRIQSKHVLMLFDSCFSGSLFALTRAVPDDISEKSNLPVRQYITAGREDEQVPDKSMFKRSLLIGLDGDADLTGDGYVTGTELGMYLSDKVVNYTHRRQHPQYGKINNPDLDRGDFIFVSPSLEQELQAKKLTGQSVKQEQPTVPVAPSGQKTQDTSLELAFWGTISNSNDVDMLKAYINKFPNGTFVELAKIKIQKLSEDAPTKKDVLQQKEETKAEPKSKVQAAVKVPEEKMPASYTDNGNGTITDNVTSLMWQKEDDNITRTWDNANSYCDNLTLAIYSDWRVPSKKELMSIVDYGTYNPSIDATYFTGTAASLYWSSTTNAYNSSFTFRVYFLNGSVYGYYKTLNHYVRCVRAGQ